MAVSTTPPAKPASSMAYAQPKPQVQRTRSPKKKQSFSVLIVEDNAVIRAIYARCFRYRGHQVAEAHDGADALRQIFAGSFDVVVLDLLLPYMSGQHVLQLLREANLETKVLVVSSLEDGDTTVDVLYKGADYFLGKSASTGFDVVRMAEALATMTSS